MTIPKRGGRNTGAYVVKVDGRRVSAYADNETARFAAAEAGGVVVWEKDGFTKTADSIFDRVPQWATEEEAHERFLAETKPVYDYVIRDCWDNGEFLTGCTLDLREGGKVMDSIEFTGSLEFGDNDGTAVTQAMSYGNAWYDARTYTLEERLGSYGIEWEAEMEER
jgi:hypothetical protein